MGGRDVNNPRALIVCDKGCRVYAGIPRSPFVGVKGKRSLAQGSDQGMSRNVLYDIEGYAAGGRKCLGTLA
jgi:hypothetical protein